MTVANEILAQLGGSKFVAMTGAKDLLGSDTALMFSLPRGFAKDGINKVRITLNAMDVYDIEFMKYSPRKLEVSVVRERSGVYAEDLRRVFKTETGLDCTL